MNPNPLNILLAEDDAGHANLVIRNLRRGGVVNQIEHVKDGQEALEFVRCEGAFADRKRSGAFLAILDIKMPRVDGVEVLRQLKSDPKTEKIPVIMLTTTDDPREID